MRHSELENICSRLDSEATAKIHVSKRFEALVPLVSEIVKDAESNSA